MITVIWESSSSDSKMQNEHQSIIMLSNWVLMFSLMMITVLVGMGHFWIVFLFSDWGNYVKEIQWIKIREEFSTNIFNRLWIYWLCQKQNWHPCQCAELTDWCGEKGPLTRGAKHDSGDTGLPKMWVEWDIIYVTKILSAVWVVKDDICYLLQSTP